MERRFPTQGGRLRLVSDEAQTLAGDRWIPESEYRQIVSRVPISCVDLLVLLPGRTDFLLIERDDYRGVRGLNLVGGAVLIDEPLTAAVQRHVRATLGPAAEVDLSTLQMVGVYEYLRKGPPTEPHDPRKHAIAVTYVGVVGGATSAQGEAHDLHTFSVLDPPPLSSFGFGQGIAVLEGLAVAART